MLSIKHSILILLLVLPSLLFSQVNLGIKAGANYNYNGFSSDSLNLAFDNATSFSGGAFVRVKIKKISLQAEGLFIGRKGTVSVTNVDKNIDFYTFDLPLLIGYKLMDLKVVKLRLNAGVVPSFHIKSVGDLEGANFKDSFYSLAGGVSLDIPLFIFDVRYQGAIGDYYALKNIDSSTKLTNSLLTFSIAWKIL
jgi:hypothetical protein